MVNRIAFFGKTWGIWLSLALLIGTSFFWYRGYRINDSASLYCGGRRFAIWSQSGQFGISVSSRDHTGAYDGKWIGVRSSSFDGIEMAEASYRVFREFGGRFRSGWQAKGIQVPAWAMTLAFGMPLVVAGLGYYRRRRSRQHASAAPQAVVAA
jgi:hypothetical protein